MSEETITISKSDLQQLIREGVAQAVGRPRVLMSYSLFKGIALEHADLSALNNKYGIETEGVGNSCAYSRRQYTDGRGIIRDGGISPYEIHDLLRKVAMAVCGEKQNSKVARMDYERVRDDYEKFRDLFIECYDARCKELADSKEV